MEKHNHCVVCCQLYTLNLGELYDMLLVLLKDFLIFCANGIEYQFLKLYISLVSFYYR